MAYGSEVVSEDVCAAYEDADSVKGADGCSDEVAWASGSGDAIGNGECVVVGSADSAGDSAECSSVVCCYDDVRVSCGE